MAPREDLVSSAVSFLQDPSVASSPLEKRIEFLKSKNLTQEEIDVALAQAANGSPTPGQSSVTPPQNQPYYPPPQYQQPPPGYGYNGYPPYNQWQQPPPPELPKRDWRDWFIMATVVGGAGYGLYALANRYIKPLIAPPTPPQLEQDKTAIDEQFNKAFALLDTLASDTATLKEAEETRTKRLDDAIADIETIIAELKSANTKREDDARRMEAEVKGMKDSLPRAIDSVRDGSERQLKDLSTELASLKLLMSNRMGGPNSTSMYGNRGSGATPPQQPQSQQQNDVSSSRNSTATPLSDVGPGSKNNVTGVNSMATAPSFAAPSTSSSSSYTTAPVASSTSSKATFGASAGKASIPSWQMAMQNNQKASTNGTTTPQADGADVVNLLNSS